MDRHIYTYVHIGMNMYVYIHMYTYLALTCQCEWLVASAWISARKIPLKTIYMKIHIYIYK